MDTRGTFKRNGKPLTKGMAVRGITKNGAEFTPGDQPNFEAIAAKIASQTAKERFTPKTPPVQEENTQQAIDEIPTVGELEVEYKQWEVSGFFEISLSNEIIQFFALKGWNIYIKKFGISFAIGGFIEFLFVPLIGESCSSSRLETRIEIDGFRDDKDYPIPSGARNFSNAIETGLSLFLESIPDLNESNE